MVAFTNYLPWDDHCEHFIAPFMCNEVDPRCNHGWWAMFNLQRWSVHQPFSHGEKSMQNFAQRLEISSSNFLSRNRWGENRGKQKQDIDFKQLNNS